MRPDAPLPAGAAVVLDPIRVEPAPRPAGRLSARVAVVPAATRHLLLGWLGLAVASLVVAGFFAMLAAFARTPAVQILPTADLFHRALISHVTFAFTVWFVTFAGALWVYVAWRSNYRLSWLASWTALWLAAGGSLGLAVPAFLGSGTPYLNDYLPVIDDPLFWAGLVLLAAGVGVQAGAYLVAALRARVERGRTAQGPPSAEAVGMAVGALAMLLAIAATLLALLRLDPLLPWSYSLRVLVWGGGHVLQFLHVAGMTSVWFVAVAVAVAGRLPAERVLRALLLALVPFMVAAAAVYLLRRPEELLINHWITVLTFGGLGAASVPLLFMTVVAASERRPLPWSSPLFSGTALSFALFAIGGVMGLVGFSQDTRVPAHYHGMVGAVTMAYMAVTPLLLELCGRRLWSERLARWQPYLYGVGLLGLMIGMHWAGGHGAPRKTFGFSWANAQALIALNVMGAGSLLAILGGLAFVVNTAVPLLRGRKGAS